MGIIFHTHIESRSNPAAGRFSDVLALLPARAVDPSG
jgi:hypothetical protein